MDGDFKGDFTRDTFYPIGHFSRMLMQQGRVQLDADWNEQIDILLHYLRTLAKDLIGPHGGPLDAGFGISTIQTPDGSNESYNFSIGGGDYYVDGILIENEVVDRDGNPMVISYKNQPYYPQLDGLPHKAADYLVYLDVWERQVTFLEDDNIHNIREVALGVAGPDTATRAQVVWQVKVISDADAGFQEIISKIVNSTDRNERRGLTAEAMKRLTDLLQPENRGKLKASALVVADNNHACITPPDARYRGAENQLYRVEIHTGGNAWDSSQKASAQSGSSKGATLVWSRENGSVVFPIIDSKPGDNNTFIVTLDSFGRDESRFRLNKNNWVEIVDDKDVLQGNPGPLLQVSNIDNITMTITLTPKSGQIATIMAGKQPRLLRLWNYRPGDPKQGGLELANDGAAKVKENTPLNLEDGIQIIFYKPSQAGGTDQAPTYRTGDYWLIPARTITGDVEWPRKKVQSGQDIHYEPLALPPDGVRHHYAPLAVISLSQDGKVKVASNADLRSAFQPLTELMDRLPR